MFLNFRYASFLELVLTHRLHQPVKFVGFHEIRQIIPAVEAYIGKIAGTAARKASVCADASMTVERDLITRLSALNAEAYEALGALRKADAEARAAGDELAVARAFRDKVVPAMQALRAPVDEMETMVASEDWPLPTYGEMTYKQ